MTQEATAHEEMKVAVPEKESQHPGVEPATLTIPDTESLTPPHQPTTSSLLESQNAEEAFKKWLSKASGRRLKKGDARSIPDSFWERLGTWADQVLPEDLWAEWEVADTVVSERFVAAWVADAEVHRLAKLADHLIAFAEKGNLSVEVLQLMTTVSGLLGIMRPLRSRRLLEMTAPHIRTHPSLEDSQTEAEVWMRAGLVLIEPELKHRVFWNNRLRNPDVEWSWESDEARQALSDLPEALAKAEPEVGALFQAVIPNFWWDLFNRSAAAGTLKMGLKAVGASSAGRNHGFAAGKMWFGLLIGALAGAGLMFFVQNGIPQPLQVAQGTPNQLAEKPVLDGKAGSADSVPSMVDPLTPAPPLLANATSTTTGTKKSALPDWRSQQIEQIRQEFPAIERLHRVLTKGTLAETENILRGGSSIAAPSTPSYRALLKWAVLDSPEDDEVRRAVIRLFSLTLPTLESFAMLEKLVAEGEPHRDEFKKMAGIMLGAAEGSLSEREKNQLERIAH